MTTLQEAYPKLWNSIGKKEISQDKIEEVFLSFLEKQIKEIKEGARDHMDIGDAFGLGFQHALGAGYKFSVLMEKLLIDLGDYNLEPMSLNEDGLRCIGDVEKRLKEIAENLPINLDKD